MPRSLEGSAPVPASRRAPAPAFLAVLALVLALAPGAAADVRPPGDDSELGNDQLSDERTVTRWAHPWTRAKIKSRTSSRARTVGRLRFRTEDGPAEVYLALRSHVGRRGQVWIQIRLLGRPNGRKGWVPREALGPFNTIQTYLVIDRTKLKATLRNKGKVVWTSRVGVGKAATPTPSGRFYIRERLRNLGGGAYGPWAFGTSAYSNLSDWPGGGVVGIHGTNQPQLIPGRPSHGCVRVPNAKINRLARIMPLGTPVRVI